MTHLADSSRPRLDESIRIFVVDPDALARVATEHVLAANGYEVAGAGATDTTYSYLIAFGPAVIVVSGVTPHAASCDFVHALRSRGVATPIFVLSERADSRDRVDALDAGADDCMTTPVSVDEFLMRLWALVRRTLPRRAAG